MSQEIKNSNTFTENSIKNFAFFLVGNLNIMKIFLQNIPSHLSSWSNVKAMVLLAIMFRIYITTCPEALLNDENRVHTNNSNVKIYELISKQQVAYLCNT